MDYTPLPQKVENASSKKPFFVALILLICVFGLVYFLYPKKDSPKGNDLITLAPTVIPTAILTPAESIEKITYQTYQNTKYHFAFDAVKEKKLGSAVTYSLTIEDRANQIIFTEKTFHDGLSDTRQYAYTLYDATAKDKDDLTAWWINTVPTDIGGLKVPVDYNSQTAYYPDESCIKLYNEKWTAPPNLFVTTIESTDSLGPYTSSIYFFYNFGVPFVLRFQENINGVCGTIDDYKNVMTIHKI